MREQKQQSPEPYTPKRKAPKSRLQDVPDPSGALEGLAHAGSAGADPSVNQELQDMLDECGCL